MLTIELLEELRTPAGGELLKRADALRDDPFAAQKLRKLAGVELCAAAVEQVRLRERARAKFNRAERMWFTAPLLEQASGELIANHRARRFCGYPEVADLCCGMGADALALAELTRVTAVDRDPLALALTHANAEELGLSDRISVSRAEIPAGAPQSPAAWTDPGRREGGRRTRRLDEISPTLQETLSLRGRISDLGIKLSPASDHTELDGALQRIPHEREVLSVTGECREMVVWTGGLARGVRRATLLPWGAEMEGVPAPLGESGPPGKYLLEPDGAVLRAGLVGNLADQLGAWPVDPRLSYLALDALTATPFATVYRIDQVEAFSARALAERLRFLNAGDVVLKTRGFAASPESLRRGLRAVLKQGQPDRAPVVFITRLGERPVTLLGERLGAGRETIE